ncbi:hypothetical protein BCR42DRAFT_410813, partial [Absidia repens]
MKTVLYYSMTLWVSFCLINFIIQALPTIPHVWLDDQGQPFAVAVDGADHIKLHNHALENHWLNVDGISNIVDDDDDDMYTTSISNLVPHQISLREKIMNYITPCWISHY